MRNVLIIISDAILCLISKSLLVPSKFHAEDRYPVVLPCGHTYVCSVCANRLDRCMECRTPLYTIVKPTVKNLNDSIAANNSDMPSWYKPRTAHAQARGNVWQSSGEHSPRADSVNSKKRVPLPKNVVLLSLMEATELASEQVNKASGGSPRGLSHANDSERPTMVLPMNSMIDIEDEEE